MNYESVFFCNSVFQTARFQQRSSPQALTKAMDSLLKAGGWVFHGVFFFVWGSTTSPQKLFVFENPEVSHHFKGSHRNLKNQLFKKREATK